jgi:hypothetical protein
MTNLRIVRHYRTTGRLLTGLLALGFASSACAWQSTPPPPIKPAKPVVISPRPDLRFQQVVQQQKARDQQQQSQLEQQLHNDVANNSRRPTATDAQVKQQRDQTTLERDQVQQQDLMNQYRQMQPLPRVVPKKLPPPDSQTGKR